MANYRPIALRIASRYKIPPGLFAALIQQESSWNPNARSPAGAQGLGQLMPDTARGLGVTNSYNPEQNLTGAAKYLAAQYARFNDWKLALAAYNAGPGAVAKYGGIPPYAETRNYVRTILANAGSLAPPVGPVSSSRVGPVAALPPSTVSAPPLLTVGAPTRGIDRASLLRALYSGNTAGFYQQLGQRGQSAGLTLNLPQPTTVAPVVAPRATGVPPSARTTPRSPLPQVGSTRIHGKIVGYPYQGSHTLFHNWESDNAVDVAMPYGTPVYAPFSGTIGSQIGALNSHDPHLEGLRLHLVGGGTEAYAAHLSRLAVKAGQHVRAGQLLGYSGRANGLEHLHWATKTGNPARYVG